MRYFCPNNKQYHFMKTISIRFSIFALFLFGFRPLFAQVIQQQISQQISQINIDQLTDAQLQQYLNQSNLTGLSEAELELRATEKGLSPEQILKLKARLRNLNMPVSSNKSGNTDSSLIRKPIKTAGPQREYNNQELKIFGEELFSQENLTFEPNLQIPTPKNYSLGTGDQVNIDLYGYSDINYSLKVSPEGTIRIPNSGPIKVAGMTFEDVTLKIKSQLTKIYPQIAEGKTSVQVSLGQIRSIRVTLIGEVTKPGSYTLSSLSTIANALYVSGGPNKIGSFRNIGLYRGGKLISRFDLYNFLLNGDLSNNLRLEEGDIIRINPYKLRVTLNGAVKRKAIYEMNPDDHMNNLLEIAGGLADIAYKGLIHVVRFNQNEKEAITVNIADFNSFSFHSGDSCYVDSIFNRYSNRINISGAVYRPGIYSLTNYPDLRSLLEATGIREDAFMKRGIIKRKGTDYLPQLVDFNIEEIKNGKAQLTLQREDSVLIFSNTELKEKKYVEINGQVNKPGKFEYISGMQLQDVLLLSGGLRESASTEKIEISRRLRDNSGEKEPEKYSIIKTVTLQQGITATPADNSFVLEPYDIISVRKNPGYREQVKVTIEGEVLYPGTYTIEDKKETISDLIQRAGGLRSSAYAIGAVLMRNTFQDSFEVKFTDSKLQSIHNQTTSTDSSSQILIQTLGQNKKIVGIHLQKALSDPQSEDNINLIEGDILSIPEIPKTVQSFGAIYVPKKVVYRSNLSFKDVIEESGGFLTTASKKHSYVIYPNGDIRTAKHFLFFRSYPPLAPGAEVYVPLHVRKLTVQEATSIGAAAASIAALVISMIYLIKTL